MIKAVSLPVAALNRNDRTWSELRARFTFVGARFLSISRRARRIVGRRRSIGLTIDYRRTNFREIFAVVVAALTVLTAGAPHADAAFYYVDARVVQSGTGRDWSRAWKSFDAIEWSRLKGGDIIFISGGTTGLTYTAPLRVATSGSPGNRIRIVRATTSGRNGRVLIDGRNRLASCVVIDGFNHISIENLAIARCTAEGIRIRNARDVIATGHSIFALSRGFHIWRTAGVIVSFNRVSTPTWGAQQNDGIYSQENVGNWYWANKIVISNSYPNGHNDGIQSYRDLAVRIGRNYIEQRNKKTGNALGIFLTDSYGSNLVLNNVVVGLYTNNSLVSMLNISHTGGWLRAYNNTLVGSKWGVIQIENAPKSTIINNILYSATAETAGITIAGTFPPAGAIDYNVYYLPSGRAGYHVSGQWYDWNSWRAMGYEGNGKISSTSPIDASFSPAVGSVALDAGVGVTAIDQRGRSRPHGAGFDIGALEKQ